MTVLSIFAPHRRAAELIDQKLDAERGEGSLSGGDRAWLEAHVARCAKCSAALEARAKQMRALRALGTAKAPEGFAGRVLLAAKTRRAPAVEEQESAWLRPMMPLSQLAIGAGMLVVVLAGAAVLFRVNDSTKPQAKDTAVAGAQGLSQIEAPHFIVRAPSVGAAKARSEITQVVEAHGGTYLDNGNAIVARIPRSDLVAVTQDLAARAAFRMTKADAGTELPADLQTIIIRFELE